MYPLEIPPGVASGQEATRWDQVRPFIVSRDLEPRPVVRAVGRVRSASPASDPLDVLALRNIEDREAIFLELADRDHRILEPLGFELTCRTWLTVVKHHRV